VVSREAQARCKVDDDCVRCLHGMGHPPLIAVFDPAAGTYVPAESPTCVAGHGYAKGELCGSEAAVAVAGIDLCAHQGAGITRSLPFIARATSPSAQFPSPMTSMPSTFPSASTSTLMLSVASTVRAISPGP
jgi:hypothetical protein